MAYLLRGAAPSRFCTCAVLIALGACSSSSSDSPAATVAIDDGGGSEAANTAPIEAGSALGCPNSVIGIAFNPMYSAYDGMHTFQIPAIVDGIAASAISWSASDPNMVAIEPDPNTGGVMITTQKAATVSIIAQAGTLCGSSLLTITSATPDLWDIGSQRYNNGTVITAGPGGQIRVNEASVDAKCTNCHGDLANGPYKTVAHTPEQTGGFSDAELQNIFRHGTVPDGGYFDTSIVSYAVWRSFHTWSMTDDEASGVIVYLRSLTPEPQAGKANFGGRGPDGGFPVPDGGRRMRPAADAGVADSASVDAPSADVSSSDPDATVGD